LNTKPEILHEDDDIIIVNKPVGWLSIPDRMDSNKENILYFLGRDVEKMFVVHRLDKETSGIICFAKNAEAHKHLSNQFEKKIVQKIYQVIVEGVVREDEGEINKGIAPHPTIPGKMMASNKGKEALTFYKVIERFKNFTLLEADIKTGRTHQIRVHFQSIGYPLAVDKMYSPKHEFLLSDIKHRKFNLAKHSEELPIMQRTTLHSFRLTMHHPSTEERIQFEAEPPKDFRAMLQQLRKWNV
jgi:23S rRNA pseudouridine1911/1915/1917 synthase